MNFFKGLITLTAIFLFATAAFGQDPSGKTPAERYGPVRSDDTRARTPTVDLDHSYFYHEPFKISQKLEIKLKTLLPQNVTPKAAARGFLDLQDFVATVRAANNLSIPFSNLKHTMADGSSKELEKAIHKLKPDVAAKDEAKKAKDQAKEDIKESKRS
jgi:hypothetical protein